jgi:hypothetical protein
VTLAAIVRYPGQEDVSTSAAISQGLQLRRMVSVSPVHVAYYTPDRSCSSRRGPETSLLATATG